MPVLGVWRCWRDVRDGGVVDSLRGRHWNNMFTRLEVVRVDDEM